MPVIATRNVAAASATLLAINTTDASFADAATQEYLLKNATGTAPVFLDGADTVTADGGFQWDPADGPLSLSLEPGEKLYGIVAATSQTVHVLATGRAF